MANHETEGNADAALQDIGGTKVDFTSLNSERGKAWETEGNADEALKSIEPVAHYGKTSSILAHGPVELLSLKDDRPKADSDRA